MSKDKLKKAYNDIMVELYANATPPADFLKLVEEAEVNEFGEKDIHYDNYEIDEDVAISIFNKHARGFNKPEREVLSFNIWLGASPKTKKK